MYKLFNDELELSLFSDVEALCKSFKNLKAYCKYLKKGTLHASAALVLYRHSADNKLKQPRSTGSVLHSVEANGHVYVGERAQRVDRIVASVVAQRQTAQVGAGRDRQGARCDQQAGTAHLSKRNAQQDARVYSVNFWYENL